MLKSKRILIPQLDCLIARTRSKCLFFLRIGNVIYLRKMALTVVFESKWIIILQWNAHILRKVGELFSLIWESYRNDRKIWLLQNIFKTEIFCAPYYYAFIFWRRCKNLIIWRKGYIQHIIFVLRKCYFEL